MQAKKIDSKQIPRNQSKLDAFMCPIAEQIIIVINNGKYIKEMGLQYVVESRVATAGMLMHKNPLGRDNWDSVQTWILKAGSGWHQAETAEDPQNMPTSSQQGH